MSSHAEKMKVLFDHLFREAGPPGGENAFTGAVTFRSGANVQGVISSMHIGDHEVLRMATPALKPHPEYPNNQRMATKVMLEHYFDHEDVECVVAMRDVDASKLDKSPGSTIILGG